MRLAANLSFLWKENLPFLGRFGAAAAAGFKAVEFMFPGDGRYAHSAHDILRELEAHRLKQVLINAPAGDWARGERGIGGICKRDDEWERSIDTAFEYAGVLGCKQVHVMAGLRQHGACEDTFVERMRWAGEIAQARGVTLLIEPLNDQDFPGYLIPDSSTAVRVLERIGLPDACKLQLDLYHLQVAEGGLCAKIRLLLPYTSHVQIANPPGRHEPGEGEVDFTYVLGLLEELGYAGYVGLEYKPLHNTPRSLEWATGLLG
eukprot:CAMPEP_0183378846 /NCGR_PEP_ID=MMETSP0164_2-20130417/125125_1 /TAXON_ID=221442 /ORGANISM="Coccolithus pelagicus ssp braarudi, Strain PLY182g" /LENGTH=260 /DNA_ID=CAMNT_0025556419 /DNA_START=48 /DNA_END=830 /DNA_ORIENTATION=+